MVLTLSLALHRAVYQRFRLTQFPAMPKRKQGQVKKDANGLRIGHTVSFPPDQDLWLMELLGEEGNLSGFMQALVDVARSGKINTTELLKNQKNDTALQRAKNYLRAKEAGMLFDEDVKACLEKNVPKGVKVVKGKIYNGHETGAVFIADFSLEKENGEVLCSVVCKSSPRADRLQLALAEAMIGTQKTGKPVVTVIPYFLQDDMAEEVVRQFKMLDYSLTALPELPDAISKWV